VDPEESKTARARMTNGLKQINHYRRRRRRHLCHPLALPMKISDKSVEGTICIPLHSIIIIIIIM
jgi:hypothetical protein